MVSLRTRVANAAEEALREQRYVSLTDVLCGLGWIHPVNVKRWRKGMLQHLELVLPPADRVMKACELLTDWARERELRAEDVEYVAATRDRRPLTFLSESTAEDERSFRTHWFAPDYSPAKREKVAERQSKPPDLVVVMPIRDWVCASCGDTDNYLFMENDEPLCLDCADMGHLVFLPSGDAALTPIFAAG